ncbi:MAG: HD-GYP domain-containing protein [Aquabacterium sp.]|uniref:HD-GYP domain-containing protein n=1 Tax=Aquabacterium sp. TaxID=1872578 RepID=UPI001209B43B|nr:HD-GYP domain-containing protein [Aquabacterium sp.]TAK99372.1 MAG: HD-GYP domain-containing protein [Aquabacterium sp.]
MSTDTATNDPYVLPEQLCIGLYVHLDLSWTEHPFTFSSFKIKSLDQIATIQGLGLKRVRYAPGKSDSKPLAAPKPGDAPAAPPPPPLPRDEDPAFHAKRARMQRLGEQRAKAAACEKELLSAAKTIKSINQNVFSRPEEVKEAAGTLIKSIADSMLVDADVSIQLMADKVGGEEVYYHSLNVSLLSMMLAKELKAPAPVVQMVGMGALFHDIGELEIPDRIVRKQEARTKAETALLQMHCEYGVNIARKMNLPNEVLQVIAQHHEKVDGSGYPSGATAAQMSLLTRIVSLVNAYDEMCNPPNAAKAMTPHEALSMMFAQQRNQYDQLAMSTFVRCMGVYPPGTIVVLSNGATAMVVSVNTSKPLRPVVLVYDPSVPKEEAIVVDLEVEQDVSITKTMRPQQLSSDAYAYLSPRKRMTYYFDTESGKVGS